MTPVRQPHHTLCTPYGDNKNKNKNQIENKKEIEKKKKTEIKNADIEPDRHWAFPAILNGTDLRLGGAL